jgi:hypothetical protein
VPRGRVWLQRFLVAGAVAALGLSLYWLATDSYDEFEGPSWLAFAFNVAIVAGVWIFGVYAGLRDGTRWSRVYAPDGPSALRNGCGKACGRATAG